jgi:hypothetical protein
MEVWLTSEGGDPWAISPIPETEDLSGIWGDRIILCQNPALFSLLSNGSNKPVEQSCPQRKGY